VDEELIPEVNADVDHLFRPAAPGAAPEKQHVALPPSAAAVPRCAALMIVVDAASSGGRCYAGLL